MPNVTMILSLAYLQQSIHMWHVQDSLASVLYVRVDPFLYQVRKCKAGQSIQ